jgi:hypothetical protein
MPSIDKVALAAIQPELLPGEKVLWAGRPSPHIIYHDRDAPLVLFSLEFGGITTVLTIKMALRAMGVSGAGSSVGDPMGNLLFILPVFLIGQYFLWGRFIWNAWKKKRTYYAVTDRQVIAVQTPPWGQVASASIDALTIVMKEKRWDGYGTLRFTPPPLENRAPRKSLFLGTDPEQDGKRKWAVWDPLWLGDGPVFVDIADVDSVHQLLPPPQVRTEAEVEAQVAALLAERQHRNSSGEGA